MLYKLVWFVHYRELALLVRWHFASCIIGIVDDLCIFAGVQYALQVDVVCALL